MNILAAYINWNIEFDNEPNLVIEVDNEKYLHCSQYECKGSYYASSNEYGFLDFFFYAGPSNEGYAGREFPIKMKDGTEKILKGPWSGNNFGAYSAGFPLSYSCTVKAPSKWIKDSWSHYAGNLIEEKFKELVEKYCPDAELYKIVKNSDYSSQCDNEQNMVIGYVTGGNINKISTYTIVKKGMTPAQTYVWKRVERYTAYLHKVTDEQRSWGLWGREEQIRMASYINGLISDNNLEKFGYKLIDLNNLPPLIHYVPPEPINWEDSEEEGD